MKLKGLPYSVTKEDIVKFFHGLGLIDDSVKIGVMTDGKLTGEACVLFETVEDCQTAHGQQNHQHIGTRWVNLIMVPPEEHKDFENNQSSKFEKKYDDYAGDSGYSGRGGRGGSGGGFRGSRGGGGSRGGRGGGRGRGGYENNRDRDEGGSGFNSGAKSVRLSDFVNEGNRYRALKMRGLPYSVGVREIRDFFGDFRVSDRDIIIDMNNGRPTGYALVFLESEDEASRAKTDLNKQYLGSRYVDLNYPDLRS